MGRPESILKNVKILRCPLPVRKLPNIVIARMLHENEGKPSLNVLENNYLEVISQEVLPSWSHGSHRVHKV